MGKIYKWDDWWHHTLNPILYQAYKWGYLGQFAVQNIETQQADSSTGNTPMAIKNSVPMATHSFPVPTHLISICWWFSAWKLLNKATNLSLHIDMLAGSCIWSAVDKYQNGMAKVAKRAFNMKRSGTQYVVMVTELLSSYRRAHLVESYC